MALAVGNIVQIIDRQTLDDNQMMNVWYFRVTVVDVDSNLAGLASAYLSDLQNQILNIQDSNLSHVGLELRNLSNGVDIHEDVTTHAGGTAGVHMPNFVAVGFRLVRATALTRHGQKRIGGVTEEMTDGNNLAAAGLAAVPAIEAAMLANITYPGTGTDEVEAEPVIVGRTLNPGTGKYELDLTRINTLSDVQYIRITSQVSRRKGRGD